MLNSLLSAQPGMINVFVLSMTKYILVYLKCALTFKHRFYMGLKIAYKWLLKFEKNIEVHFCRAEFKYVSRCIIYPCPHLHRHPFVHFIVRCDVAFENEIVG